MRPDPFAVLVRIAQAVAHWLSGRGNKPAAFAAQDFADLLEQIVDHKNDLRGALEKGTAFSDALAPWLGPQAYALAKDLLLIESLDKFRTAFADGSTKPPAPFI